MAFRIGSAERKNPLGRAAPDGILLAERPALRPKRHQPAA
jgi:hypothetical protein